MYDKRLRLANMVVDEVTKHFKKETYKTIIHRNSKISEAPNLHMPVVLYDAASKGAINFFNLANEFLANNEKGRKKGKPTKKKKKKKKVS